MSVIDEEFNQLVDRAYRLLNMIEKKLLRKEEARSELKKLANDVLNWMKKKPLEGSHLSRAIYISQFLKLIDQKIETLLR